MAMDDAAAFPFEVSGQSTETGESPQMSLLWVKEYGVDSVATWERTIQPAEVLRVRVPEDWASAKGNRKADKTMERNMIWE
jgi:hypothetical protein